MLKARKYVLKKPFINFPKETDYHIIEEILPPIKDGEFLAKALYIQAHPMEIEYSSTEIGNSMFVSHQLAKIIKSKNQNFPVGEYVEGYYGWRTYTIANGTEMHRNPGHPISTLQPNLQNLELPLTNVLSLFGQTGLMAYSVFLDFCNPKPGNTVVITAAESAFGNLAGQLAKIRRCRVIGIVDSDAKGEWIVNEFKFDHFVNTNKANFKECLIECTPNKIDCLLDLMMGKDVLKTASERLNVNGKQIVCEREGNCYKFRQAHRVGDSVPKQSMPTKIFADLKHWIKTGELKVAEVIVKGFDNLFKAFDDTRKNKYYGATVIVEV